MRQLEREAEAERRRQEQEAARLERERQKAEEKRRQERQRAAKDITGTLLSPIFGKRTSQQIARGIFGTRR